MNLLPILSLLVVLVLSIVVVRVATVALTLTGLSRQLARFQARSAFTGAGFTTSESEKVVGHPIRRRIIMLLMLLGNAGIVTAVSSLILSFSRVTENGTFAGSVWFRILVLIAGMTALWAVVHSRWVDDGMSRVIMWALKRWTDLEVRDYASLLHLSGDYAVAELTVQAGDWLADRSLAGLRLWDEGVLVLGVEQVGGDYVGGPRGTVELRVGDTVILYGPRETLEGLDRRSAGSSGNWQHFTAVEQQKQAQADDQA